MPGDDRSAVTLALALAAAEERHHNASRARQALDAARALHPGVRDRADGERPVRLAEAVPLM